MIINLNWDALIYEKCITKYFRFFFICTFLYYYYYLFIFQQNRLLFDTELFSLNIGIFILVVFCNVILIIKRQVLNKIDQKQRFINMNSLLLWPFSFSLVLIFSSCWTKLQKLCINYLIKIA